MTWFHHRRERPDAVARLFCLHYAGGSALLYRTWAALAPAELELCPVQLPGRDERRDEPAIRRMSDLVEALAHAIEPLSDLPFGLFGHSMGARVAFELVRTLRDRGARLPEQLFVSGSRAPHVPSGGPDLHRLADAELIEELRRMGGTPACILDDRLAAADLLALVRADFELLETYHFDGLDRIGCDITAFRGAGDSFATREGMQAWETLTEGRFAMRTFPGNHFFLQPNGRAVLTETGVRLFRSLSTVCA